MALPAPAIPAAAKGNPTPPLAPRWNMAAVKTDAETGFALVESDSGRRVVPFRDFGDGFTTFGGETEFEFDMASGDYVALDDEGRLGDRLSIIACARDEASLTARVIPIRAQADPAPAKPAEPARQPDYDEELGF